MVAPHYPIDLTPALVARALDEARRQSRRGNYATALDRYATFLGLAKSLRQTGGADSASDGFELRQALREREELRRREVRPETGRGRRYTSWYADGTHRQRLYTPQATGLYETLRLTGPGALEKPSARRQRAPSLPNSALYLSRSKAWDNTALFRSTGLTGLRALDPVVAGACRAEEAYGRTRYGY